MPHVTQATSHKAKKRHRCSWCGESILPGEEYYRYRYYDGPDASTVKMHLECKKDLDRSVDSQGGGYFEWTPGEFKRPSKENHDKTS